MADTPEDPRSPAPVGPAGGAAAPADAPPQEQDTLFRLQMAISDFVLGNVKYTGVLVGIVLLGALVYGLTTSWLNSREAEEFAAISRIDYKMPKVDQLATFGLAPMDDKTDTARMANVAEGARRYQAAGDTSHGAAAVYAYLKASDAWKRCDKPEEALAALQKANAVGAKDLAGYTAAAAYAGALRDAGKVDDAVQVYRDAANRLKGFYAERALISLADTQLLAGKGGDAKLVVDEFKRQFPASPRLAEMAAIEQKIGTGG